MKRGSKAEATGYKLRAEQREAVGVTKAYWEKCQKDSSLEASFLWNAKPRFGKTLAAYSFAAEIQAAKVLIVTNRPAIADSWYSDFKKFGFQDVDGRAGWIFTSSEAVRRRLGKPAEVITRQKQIQNRELLAKNTLHFISLQDIKGKDLAGFKDKNKWIFELDWDLIIIDESHEGVDTDKTFRTFSKVKRKFTLYLSGTPFRALASERFHEEQIYNWSYMDEQRAKRDWKSTEANPYADLPEMQIYSYQLFRALDLSTAEARETSSDYAFNLSELFRVTDDGNGERFVHEEKVRLLIKNLGNPHRHYAFATEERREILRHTLWLLPGVKACQQLKRILLEDSYFGKNYRPEEIIVAAGQGDRDNKSATALEEVRQRIGIDGSTKAFDEARTITLSCGQLTTGVTVPAWTGAIILCNCRSSSLYIQTAFRTQNPFSARRNTGEEFRKEQCYVFDFAPEQLLKTLIEMARVGDTNLPVGVSEQKLRELLNFLPVKIESSQGRLRRLKADEVLTMPLELAAEEVIKRGFISNRLFRNIGNVFGYPQEVKRALSKLASTHGDTDISVRPRIWVDQKNQIHINDEIVIPSSDGLFGDRQYVTLGTPEAAEVQRILDQAVEQAKLAGYSLKAIEIVEKSLAERLPQIILEEDIEARKTLKKKPADQPPSPDAKTGDELTREYLRNFTRVIPCLLMAYGRENTTLANLTDPVPEKEFRELTGISKADFRKLRDGVDYEILGKNNRTQIVHFPGVFNTDIFNAAIKAFAQKRTELAEYYKDAPEQDILSYLPAQVNGQVFTPRAVINQMLDELERIAPKIFQSTKSRFIDINMKSSGFIREIVRRLYVGTRDKYASEQACMKHIFERQVYGLAPTTTLGLLAKNCLFDFDTEQKISQSNFQVVNTAKAAKHGSLEKEINNYFNNGEEMKFTAVVGNPPYQRVVGKTQAQAQSNSAWVYHYFQESADRLGDYTCLVYPFGGWFDAPEQLGGLGERILSDGHTRLIQAYEGTTDKRAWYRRDREPQPIFGNETNLSAGVAIVLRDMTKQYSSFEFANQIYSDVRVEVDLQDGQALTPNPAFLAISKKLRDPKLNHRMRKGLFGIESNFVELNPEKVSNRAKTWQEPIRLLANDCSGPAGRTKLYWTERKFISKGGRYLDLYKVIIPSAYPKKALVSSVPDIEAVRPRTRELIELLPAGSAFGASRMAIFMSESEQECENFLKYTRTDFFLALLLQEPNRRSSFGDVIPDQDFSNQSDIDWAKPTEEVSEQLCQKYGLTREEKKFLGIQ